MADHLISGNLDFIQGKKDFEIQAKKDAKIQAKKDAKIQAKKDAKIQAKKDFEIQAKQLIRFHMEAKFRMQGEKTGREVPGPLKKVLGLLDFFCKVYTC